MRLAADLRVYGEIRGLSQAAWRKLAPDCPLQGAVWADGVLNLEYEGGWVDALPFLEAVATALGPEGDGDADIIDNEAWTITRCHLAAGKLKSQTFDIDNVLENTKGEGNI